MTSISRVSGQSSEYAHQLVIRWKILSNRLKKIERDGREPLRMWNVPPWMLCQQHLGGEHVEMHMLVGTINKGTSVTGYVQDGLVEVHHIRARHDLLEEEGRRRGYNYNSPLPECSLWKAGEVDVSSNIIELMERCEACKHRILFLEPPERR